MKKPSFVTSFAIIAFMFLVIIAQLATGNSPEIHITLVFAITFAVIVLMAKQASALATMAAGTFSP